MGELAIELSDLPWPGGVTHRDVEVDGVRLHVAEAGRGPPLLMLHGWPQHSWAWRRLMPRLARDFRLLAPDLRGWGWSDAPPGAYAKATFASDVLALLDAERLDRVQIMGHDWGGYSALLLALEHPERVERVLALDVAPPWPQRMRPHPGQLAAPLLATYQVLLATPVLGARAMTTSKHFVRTAIRAGSGPNAVWSTAELDAYAAVLCDPARARATSACYRTFLTRELPAIALQGDRSRDLQVPTFLAMGEASALRHVLAPRPGPNLQVTTVPGAGHFLPEEAPGELLDLALDWFRA